MLHEVPLFKPSGATVSAILGLTPSDS
jgi:hypothetical protein